MWLRTLLCNTLMECTNAIVIYSESQSAINLASNEAINRRNQHIDITFAFMQDVVLQEEVELENEPANGIADLLTKTLRCVAIDTLETLRNGKQGEV